MDKAEDIKIQHSSHLKQTLEEVLDVDEITLIPTGNGDIIDGAREQWNDGSNTLCIRPGVVVTYDRMFLINCYVSMVSKLLKFLEVNLYVVERGPSSV